MRLALSQLIRAIPSYDVLEAEQIAAIGTGALALAVGDWRLALRLALSCGLTAGLHLPRGDDPL